MNSDPVLDSIRMLEAQQSLPPKGWASCGGWLFRSPSGRVHDLSASDLNQLDRIDLEGLCLA